MNFFGNKVYKYLNKKWYFDQVYNEYIVLWILNFGYKISFKLIDRSVIEFFGPYGISNSIVLASKGVARFQSGLMYHYAFIMLVGVTFLVATICLWDYFSGLVDPRLYGILILGCSIVKK
jgi:NADH:ubiquinone oxidoreductase subunit 5 (subunit L)/multisubunit Na+/H+ antiporter MnhA subunit